MSYRPKGEKRGEDNFLTLFDVVQTEGGEEGEDTLLTLFDVVPAEDRRERDTCCLLTLFDVIRTKGDGRRKKKFNTCWPRLTLY